MEILSSSPSPAQIEAVLASTHSNSSETLRLVSLLLKHTVPETFLLLPPTTQNAIVQVFRSPVGLGNLVARISLLCSSRADVHVDKESAVRPYTELLKKVLAPGLVTQLLSSPAAREIQNLLFKGKLYAVIQEARHNFPVLDIPPQISDLHRYTAFLTGEILAVDNVSSLVPSLLSLGSAPAFFDVSFSEQNLPFLARAVPQLKRFERKSFSLKFLDFLVPRFFARPSPESILALSVLANAFLDNSIWDDLMVENVVSKYNYGLNSLAALLVSDPSAAAKSLLVAWGNSQLMTTEPLAKQSVRTHLLVCLCAQLPAAEVDALLKSHPFVTAISNRLSSLSSQAKSMAVFFANRACGFAQTAPIFPETPIDTDIPSNEIIRSEYSLSVEAAWEILATPQVIEPESEDIQNLASDLGPLSLKQKPDFQSDIDRDSNFDSDEEDDPTLASSAKVQKPIYVRDLLEYLTVDEKASQAYEKRRMALQIAPTLLRQKSAFGSEVSFYAEDLLTQLVALTNHFQDADFDTLRLNAMIAVVVSHPDVTPHLCNLLLTGDYSLQQRLCLLSAMGLGARALRGYKDDSVESSFAQNQFPSKMLPKNLHNEYAKLDGGYSKFEQVEYSKFDQGYARIENSIQNELMEEASEEAQNKLAGGKVLRISARLKKKSHSSEISKDVHASFRDIVGKRFFFPLVAVWYESGGISIGHYTPVLIGHYLRTLSLILHCAYPSAVDMNSMAGEYLTLVTPVLQKVAVDQLQVIESVVTGVMMVCEIVDQVYLVTHFDGSLHIIERAISGWWESLIDERVKSLCAGLLLRMAALRDDMERVLLGQNGFY